MSYHIVQKIKIKDGKVFITGADNNYLKITLAELLISRDNRIRRHAVALNKALSSLKFGFYQIYGLTLASQSPREWKYIASATILEEAEQKAAAERNNYLIIRITNGPTIIKEI